MMIALPNPDRSYTLTLFLPWRLFESLDAAASGAGAAASSLVRDFFAEHFADALPLIPDVEGQFKQNPTSAWGWGW